SRRKRHEANVAQFRTNWFVASADDQIDALEAARALAELPQSHREVIVARLWGGLAYQEIAEVLEISSSSAHRYYEAGIVLLREKLGVTWLKNSP
ncbi:MAG: hypothetical protein JWM11_6976, partial [Planctomycetaceae bacterium]|nr:hypothetical protein [Planctomycetaceae bacterium]